MLSIWGHGPPMARINSGFSLEKGTKTSFQSTWSLMSAQTGAWHQSKWGVKGVITGWETKNICYFQTPGVGPKSEQMLNEHMLTGWWTIRALINWNWPRQHPWWRGRDRFSREKLSALEIGAVLLISHSSPVKSMSVHCFSKKFRAWRGWLS